MSEDAAPSTDRPGFDPEIAAFLENLPAFGALDATTLPMIRPYSSAPVEPLLESRAVRRREESVLTDDGTRLPITVISPETGTGLAPGVLWLHGGGMVMGDRFSQIDIPLDWLDELGAVVVTVDYRLAPEATGTTLVEDGYAALIWLADHADELGVDPTRLIVAGTSAGGGVAAGVTLLARDRGTSSIAAQVLICPMLDHRGITVSAQQYPAPGVWSRESNEFAWNAVLGDIDRDRVSLYLSPALADDLAGLPTTYIDAGSAEVFRDEDQQYASRIWAAGGQAELHIWAGGTHGFDAMLPAAALSQAARAARTAWLRRVLNAVPAAS
ncbi:alpha/beta hydrolase [Herbiconiux ginsengi]|uniref:Acetyl esterase/lipase n=1 Tax=Herbiconiux ginsengi TaxID=381665 RepID=A0A1H3LK05_9MICO|nr:alpha/beta hydrolase [Herbiconiux ginsengi]SDY64630.1 Acetyl esterase/lipase [Herbiconiux ginsengi]